MNSPETARVARQAAKADRTWRRFELKNTKTHGVATSVAAYRQVFDAGSWTTIVDASAEFDVWDDLGIFYGRGRATYAAPNDAGSIGWAQFNGESDRWSVRLLEPHALLVFGTVSSIAPVPGGVQTAELYGPEVMQPTGGLIVDQDPASDLTVFDPMEEARVGAHCVAAWHESYGGTAGAWILLHVAPYVP